MLEALQVYREETARLEEHAEECRVAGREVSGVCPLLNYSVYRHCLLLCCIAPSTPGSPPHCCHGQPKGKYSVVSNVPTSVNTGK